MAKDWNKEFAFYAASLYRIGNYTDAALVSAIMFEKAIKQACQKNKIIIEDSDNFNLAVAISDLCYAFPEKYNRDLLHRIRKNIRNKVVHEIAIEKIDPNIIKKMVNITWKMLDKVRYKKYGKTPEKIDFLIADYHVVGIRELFNKQFSDEQAKQEPFIKFEHSDFEELYLMRNKMFSLASKIEEEILQTKYERKLKLILFRKLIQLLHMYGCLCMHTMK